MLKSNCEGLSPKKLQLWIAKILLSVLPQSKADGEFFLKYEKNQEKNEDVEQETSEIVDWSIDALEPISAAVKLVIAK